MKVTLSMPNMKREKIVRSWKFAGLFLAASLFLSGCADFGNSNTSPQVVESGGGDTPLSPSEAVVTATNIPNPDPTVTDPPESTQAPAIPEPEDYDWVQVAEGFVQPLLVIHAGDGSGRLFVVGQQGVIWVFANGEVLPKFFLDIRERVGSEGNEQGLLGLAFHPQYEQNGYFYINYTDVNGDTVVARFEVSTDPNRAEAGSQEILLRVGQPYSNHNGGHLEFGPEGYLYIGLGDGGSAGDPQGNGQSVNTLLGSLLRIDVDGGQPYAIPPDNPFANGGGRSEIWAYGLRNPWRFSFDSLTNDLYIADVGQNKWEEINFLPEGTPGGANFGWDYFEGNHPYQGEPPAGLNTILPVAEYDHSRGGCSVTGGGVYRGESLPEWQGVYFYGDFCSGEIFGLVQLSNGQWQSELLYDLPILITSFGFDEQGEFYVLGRGGGLYMLSHTP